MNNTFYSKNDYRYYLAHHGVKGMKWGVRKDTYNSNYSKEQRLRDKTVYGRSGVKRINRNMNRGHSISSARSMEADRIGAARRRARVMGQAGSSIGAIGGAVAGLVISRKYMSKFGNDPIIQMAASAAISSGASSISTQLGRYGGQTIGMLSGGYNPRKYRG